MKIRLLFPCVHCVMDSGGCSKVLFCGCIISSKGFIIFYTNFSIWVVLPLFYCMVSAVSILKYLRNMQGEMPARTQYCKYQTEQAGRGSFLQVLHPSSSSLKQIISPALQEMGFCAFCTQTDWSWSAGSPVQLWGTHSGCEAFFPTQYFSMCKFCFR